MVACRQLMDSLIPRGMGTEEAYNLYPLPTFNKWVDLSNCLHMWETALSYLKEGDREAYEWLATWPDAVHPDLCYEIRMQRNAFRNNP